jgi:methylenetetrahydrofolate reductase (NADPH)
MQIHNLFDKQKTIVSFEVFPPKATVPLESIFKTTEGLQALNPDFVSITYGAAGSSSGRTLETADKVKNAYGIEALAHLTCITSSREDIDSILDQLQNHHIENILALRGDMPINKTAQENLTTNYRYAMDVITHIKSRNYFSIAAAAYPEGHMECNSLAEDTAHLQQKIVAGADFLITQVFFDNSIFYKFLDRIQKAGISAPICAGIMPLLTIKQIARIRSLCGASIPKPLQLIIDKYEHKPLDLEKAGIEYACEQITNLVANQVDGIHLYTMNKLEHSKFIIQQTGLR